MHKCWVSLWIMQESTISVTSKFDMQNTNLHIGTEISLFIMFTHTHAHAHAHTHIHIYYHHLMDLKYDTWIQFSIHVFGRCHVQVTLVFKVFCHWVHNIGSISICWSPYCRYLHVTTSTVANWFVNTPDVCKISVGVFNLALGSCVVSEEPWLSTAVSLM